MATRPFRRGFLLLVLGTLCLAARLEARPLYRSLFHAFDFGGTAIGVQLEDLNADGKLDLVAPIFTPPSLLVRLGDGEGDFGAPTFLSLPDRPSALAVARLNADAHPDLLVTNGPGTLSIFYGLGDGTFASRLDIPVSGNPTSVAVGDVNEDGRQDVAVTCGTMAKVQILFGFMDSFFYPITEFPTGLGPAGAVLRDVSGDSHLDLVVMTQGAGNLSVFLGDGAGGFGAPADMQGPPTERNLTVADLNADARPDIAVTSGTTAAVWIYLGMGGGTFGAPSAYPANDTPRGLVAATFDADAVPDLLIANTTPGKASLLLGNGDGSFAAPLTIGVEVGPAEVAAGDLDGDGKMDFAAANSSAISIHLGNGDGTFGIQAGTYEVGPGHKVIAVADLDHDGALDLAVTSYAGSTLSVLFGRGDGFFDAGPVLATPATPQGVAAGDLNEDGLEDLVTVSSIANSYTLFMGTGPRTWSAGTTTPLATGPFICSLQDLNGDHHLDLIVLKYEWVNVFLGNGDGTFQPYTSYRVANFDAAYLADLEVCDVDHDGAQDLVASQLGCCPGRIWVLKGNGDGTFQPRSVVWEAPNSSATALGSGQLNADSNLDLAVGVTASPSSSSLGTLPGDGSGGFGSLNEKGAAFRPVWIEVGDLNHDDHDDIVVANRSFPYVVSVHIGDGAGIFLPRLDFGIGGGATCVRIADLDQDADADLVVGDTNSNRIWVLLSQRTIPTDTAERPAESRSGLHLTASEGADGRVRLAYTGAAATGPMQFAVYDVRGRLVRKWDVRAGTFTGAAVSVWDRSDARGTRVGRGIYFVRLRMATATATCKVPLVRP